MKNDCVRTGMLEFPCDVERLPNGNTLIADAGGNTGIGSEIIEVDRAGQIVWRCAPGLRFAHSAKRMENGNTLITDTTNNRVIEVARNGEIVFNTDDWGGGRGKLSDGSRLHYPNDAHPLPDGTLLITDRNNDRCLIADRSGKLLWEFRSAVHPHNADPLANGNILLANSDGNSVIEVDRRGQVVWSYSNPNDPLSWPRDADRLPNGNSLITDSKNSRIIEVDPKGRTVWSYRARHFANFYDADLLENGNVLVSDQQHHRVLEVDRFGNIIWEFRNDRSEHTVHFELMNGKFERRGEDGLPEHWLAYVKTSEGGGRIIWEEGPEGRACPGVEFDRAGAFCLYQVVAVEPGQDYVLTGEIRTRMQPGAAVAFFQLAFLDEYGGLVADVSESPKGSVLTESREWFKDIVKARAPEQATAVEVRLLISGPGRAWMRNLSFGPSAGGN